jgi:hypothetical protein
MQTTQAVREAPSKRAFSSLQAADFFQEAQFFQKSG